MVTGCSSGPLPPGGPATARPSRPPPVFHSHAGRHLVPVVATSRPAADHRSTAALRPLVEVIVLVIVAAVLAVLWLLGAVAFHITAFAIHLLLIIAVIVVIAHFVTRGRSRA